MLLFLRSVLSVELHPQRKWILDCLADPVKRWSNNAIADLLDPPLTAATISKYRRRVLQTAGAHVLPKVHRKNAVREMNSVQEMNDSPYDAAKQDLISRLQKYSLRRERWISDAEAQTVRDRDGLPVIDPSTNLPVKTVNHQALSAHDRNNMSALELEGRLTGALTEQGNQTNVQIAVLAPGSAAMDAPAVSGVQVFDIGKTRA